MTKISIEKSRKPVLIDIKLESVLDGVYLVDFEGDYIVIKKNGKLYGFVKTKNETPTDILVELDWNNWRTTKALYLVEQLKISYTLKET